MSKADINMMEKLLIDFVMQKPRTFRIHISHCDADGLLCSVIVKFFDERVRRNRHSIHFDDPTNRLKKKNIVFRNCEAGFEKVKAATLDAVAALVEDSSYMVGYDDIQILYTDLGGIDPVAIEKMLAEKGHVVSTLVIDHHKDILGIGESPAQFRTVIGQDVILNSAWYTVPGQGACALVFNALSKVLRDWRYFNFDPFPDGYNPEDDPDRPYLANLARGVKNMGEIVSYVAKADVGEWDQWNCPTSELGPISAYRLLYSFYLRIPDGNKRYLEDMYRYFISPVDVSARYMSMWSSIIHQEHKSLIDEYEKFRKELRESANDFESVVKDEYVHSVINALNARGWRASWICLGSVNDPEPFPNYSMLAKAYLIDNPGVDCIIGYNTDKGKMMLRSYKENVDLAELCAEFGGGGHPRASGFHIPPNVLLV